MHFRILLTPIVVGQLQIMHPDFDFDFFAGSAVGASNSCLESNFSLAESCLLHFRHGNNILGSLS